ncbi:hypothetical protein BDF22DRAFT_48141 [Syncephalis plumigaleata]|nr:hypothetical protein BDF22DRAFT_48141 [Syncephalis plumigaleata]
MPKSPQGSRKWNGNPINKLFCKRDRSNSNSVDPFASGPGSVMAESMNGSDIDPNLHSPTLITHIRRISLGDISRRGASSLDLARPDYGPLPYQRTDKPHVKNILPNGGVWLDSDTPTSPLRSSPLSHPQWNLPLASFTSVGISTGAIPMSTRTSSGVSSSSSASTVIGSSGASSRTSPRKRRSSSSGATLTTQVGSFVTGMHLWSNLRQPPSVNASSTHLAFAESNGLASSNAKYSATSKSMPSSPALTAQRLRDRPHRPHHQHTYSDVTSSHQSNRTGEEPMLNESWQQLKQQLQHQKQQQQQQQPTIELLLPPSMKLTRGTSKEGRNKRVPRHKHSNSTSTCASSSISPRQPTFNKDATDYELACLHRIVRILYKPPLPQKQCLPLNR